MRTRLRLLVNDSQRRLQRLRRQLDADVARWFPTLAPQVTSSTPPHSCASSTTSHASTPGHHAGDSQARLPPVKALRSAPPPLRGAYGLDRGSAEPTSSNGVMAKETAGLTN